eukprot:2234957-Pleurochrysis_carterae.AAC.5
MPVGISGMSVEILFNFILDQHASADPRCDAHTHAIARPLRRPPLSVHHPYRDACARSLVCTRVVNIVTAGRAASGRARRRIGWEEEAA